MRGALMVADGPDGAGWGSRERLIWACAIVGSNARARLPPRAAASPTHFPPSARVECSFMFGFSSRTAVVVMGADRTRLCAPGTRCAACSLASETYSRTHKMGMAIKRILPVSTCRMQESIPSGNRCGQIHRRALLLIIDAARQCVKVGAKPRKEDLPVAR